MVIKKNNFNTNIKNISKLLFSSKYLILYRLLFIVLITILLFFIFNKKNLNKYDNFQLMNNNKKIAFCFLIYDKINHEDIWYEYFKGINKNKYNIYIHYKENKPLKYFDSYKLNNCIPTKWGDISLVKAQNLILKEALRDKDNQHFIWVSGHCIPFKSFNHTYDYLDVNKSYFNQFVDIDVNLNYKYKNKFVKKEDILKYIDEKNIKKASMQSILNRKHAQLFVDNDKNINKWFKNDYLNNVPDEIVYFTLLHHYGYRDELVLTDNIAAGSIIMSSWVDMSNYKKFNNSILSKTSPNNYKHICEEELDYFINSNSLFGRKFEEGCTGLDNLIDKIKKK